MHTKTKAIGIFGGTFDPIHLGHLRMAIELYETLKLGKVHIVPCAQPVHRRQPIAPADVRFEMIKQAVESEASLVADDREIRRSGPSYMIDTLLDLRTEMPNTPLCLMLGIDAFLSFTSWHRWEEIFENAHLIVAHRPNFELPQTGAILDLLQSKLQHDAAYIHQHSAGGILLRPITALDISASDIRKQIAMGRNPRYLLPDKVYNYINLNGTYSIRI